MVFSPDYFAARERFRKAADRIGCRLEALPAAAPGPGGRELTTDVAVAGPDDAAATLLVSSGLHGVEGFFGSAVQCAALEAWLATAPPPPGVRLVLVHALNPYGFAWLRRVEEDNVDPNRNFLPDGEPYAGSPPAYGEMDGLLNPRRPDRWWRPLTLRLAWQVLRRGLPAVKQAVAAGQYDYPRGLFYGGARPGAAARLVRDRLRNWAAGSRRVLHLDFHTGLGRRAACKLLADYPLRPDRERRLREHFGPAALDRCDPRGVAYHARGGLGPWCVAHCPDVDYTFLTAEFGTYPLLTVLAGLREENRAHHFGRAGGAATLRARERLRELFCPRCPAWRHAALGAGLDLLRRGVAGLLPAGAPAAS